MFKVVNDENLNNYKVNVINLDVMATLIDKWEDGTLPQECFMAVDDKSDEPFVCLDNTTDECFINDFVKEEDARHWLTDPDLVDEKRHRCNEWAKTHGYNLEDLIAKDDSVDDKKEDVKEDKKEGRKDNAKENSPAR